MDTQFVYRFFSNKTNINTHVCHQFHFPLLTIINTCGSTCASTCIVNTVNCIENMVVDALVNVARHCCYDLK